MADGTSSGMRPAIFAFAIIGIVAPLPAVHGQAADSTGARSCVAVSDSLRTPPDARLRPGTYTLTMVATSGSKTGATIVGTLWLWRTSPNDRSPRTGELPERNDTLATPFYGATNADLREAGVAIEEAPYLTPPASRDP